MKDYIHPDQLSIAPQQLDLSLQIAPSLNDDQLGTEAEWRMIFSRWQTLLLQEYDLEDIALPWELTLKFTDDREIEELNQRFRHRHQPTDVLAFASLEVDMPLIEGQPTYLGDIVVSVETADRQARAQNWQLPQELLWLASHGFLHLLGWDHPDEPSLQIMWDIQELLMASLRPTR
jgi:probable rRNA maturation factor